VSADVIGVLLLLGAAFAVGWIARGRGGKHGPDAQPAEGLSVAELIVAAEAALDRAVVAGSAARAMATGTDRGDPMRAVTLDVLTKATAELAPHVERLTAELAGDGRHPLVEELADGATAIGLVEEWLAGGGDPAGAEAARGLERAARDALVRYRRLARAVAPLVY
jgi:hypothetical protein